MPSLVGGRLSADVGGRREEEALQDCTSDASRPTRRLDISEDDDCIEGLPTRSFKDMPKISVFSPFFLYFSLYLYIFSFFFN